MTDTVGREREQLLRFCEERFPDHYSGFTVDPSQHGTIVYRRPHPDFDHSVSAAFKEMRLFFVDAEFSRQRLQQIYQELVEALKSRPPDAIPIRSVGFSADRVSVGLLPQDMETGRASLANRYGNAVQVSEAPGNLIHPVLVLNERQREELDRQLRPMWENLPPKRLLRPGEPRP